jgi:hypothetical protein
MQPGFGGIRQGYRVGGQGGRAEEGPVDRPGGPSTGGGKGPKGPETTQREKGIMAFGLGPKGTTGRVSQPGGGRNPTAQFGPKPIAYYDDFSTPRNFMVTARKKVNPLGRLTEIPGTIGFISRALTPNPFGFGPPNMEFKDPTREDERGDIPIWMQLGYSSEAEYNAAMAGGASPSEPAESDPPVNLNRMAYRLMAEGGVAMDDEPRQAYGLGSIVKKAARAVKKVAKSDLGKLALTAAAIYFAPAAFGGTPGFGAGSTYGNFFSGLGKKAALNRSLLANLPSTVSDRLATQAAKTAMGTGSKGILGSLGIGKVGAGITALSALPFFMGDEQKEEEERQLPAYLAEGIEIPENQFRLMAEGGSTEEKEPVAKKVMPLIDMDGKEKDYRETGGFVDMGRMEKADDVPARLSKNEFVFTADAVRNAGDGSVDKGAEVMYNMMKNLEAGGEVSEESQGLEGARKMFKTSQRLEEVL